MPVKRHALAHEDPEQEFFTTSEVAHFLGRSLPYIYKRIAAGEMRTVLIGGRRRIRKAEWKAFQAREASGARGARSGRGNGEVLLAEEIAARLGVNVSRVYQMLRAGAIPCVRQGNRVWVKREVWEAWLTERERAEAQRRAGEAAWLAQVRREQQERYGFILEDGELKPSPPK